jgi:hypothetical protein
MDLEVFSSSPGSEEPMDLSLPQDRIRSEVKENTTSLQKVRRIEAMDLSLPQDRIRSGQREYNLLCSRKIPA